MRKLLYNKNNRNKLLIILGIVFLFGLTTYYTYAYFSSDVSGNEDAKSVEVTTGTLILEYNDKAGTLLSVYNAMPGVTASKEFTVKNVGTLDATYDILWKDVVNNFADKTDLYYTLTCSTDNNDGECREVTSETQLPNTTSNQEMVKSINIKVGETQTYKLEVSFPNKDEDQNDNQGKSVTANVQIVQYSKPTITMDVQDGTIDKASSIVEYAGNDTFTVTPNTGYYLENMNVSCNNTSNITVVDNEITIGPVYLSNTCNITFTPSYDIHGYVVDQNNDPVANAEVEIHSSIKTAVTDATGYFEINSVITGDHELKVIRNEESLHDSNFKIQKNHEFNIAGNTITAVNTTDPIKIKVTLDSENEKTIERDNTYRVTINAVNGSTSKELDRVESGNPSNINITPNTGYDYTSINCTNGVTGVWNNNTFSINSVEKDTACTIGFGAETYELSMDTHNTQGVLYKNVIYDAAYGTLSTQTKEYYNFNGWFTSETGGSEVTSETIVTTASNHTIHAQYSPKSYDVVYNCTENGGTCNIPNESVTYGQSIDLTKTASKENYTFIGWNTDSNATIGLSNLIMDTAGKTLYAIYQKIINVTYNASGSTLSKLSDSCTIYNNASECTFTSPTITREGYEIIGFNTIESAATSSLNVNTSYSVSSSVTYYAITIDNIAPRITLSPSSNTTYQMTQEVIINISDGASGLKSGQSLKYGWSTSNTVEPSSYTNVNLSNNEGELNTSITVSNNALTGQYYLWASSTDGICDVKNNCNTDAVKSEGLYYFDNTEPNISAYNATLSSNNVTATITASDSETGIKYYYYGYTTGGTCSGISYYSSSNSTYNFTGLNNGTYLICMYATNNLEKPSSVVSKTLTISIQESFAYGSATSYTFKPPKNGYYYVELWGASSSGYGGYTSGYIYMTTAETYYVYVGGAPGGWSTTGTFNGGGGGSGGGDGLSNCGQWQQYSSSNNSRPGGGATDIRYAGTELNNRIMVAGGAGGRSESNAGGGSGGGLSGVSGTNGAAGTQTGGYALGQGGAGAFRTTSSSNGACLTYYSNRNAGGGGGGGYYGGIGGTNENGTGGGGSSYISGHTGCVAIGAASGCTQGTSNNICSVHSSGKSFSSTLMIDGSGNRWTTGNAGQQQMPNPDGGYYAAGTGRSGSGYAKITYQSGMISYSLAVNLNGGSTDVGYPSSVVSNQTITLINPRKWGYLFNGWSVSGTGAKVSNNILTVGSGNVTVTANWVERDVYDYTYVASKQEFLVPRSGYYQVEMWGASSGSYGGYTSGRIYMNVGETYYVYVGATPTGFSTSGTFNGGGGASGGGEAEYNGGAYIWGNNSNDSRPGGGATDLRYGGTSVYDRIMVAGGSGGNAVSAVGAAAGGLNGYSGGGSAGYQTSGFAFGQGGNGTSAGQSCNYNNDLSYCSDKDAGGGGGGGYWGGRGGAKSAGSGGGGSSYISGHTGSVAIASSGATTAKSGCSQGTSDNSCSIHFSSKSFTNTSIIDGSGYSWTTSRSSQQQIPNPSGGYFDTGVGLSGNGYARFTFISQ